MERRKSPRLGLTLNISFSPAGQRERFTGSGMTENVSAGGLYFRTSDWRQVREGETLDLTVTGLSHYDHGPLFRTLRGQATVLRLDTPESPEDLRARPGIAVRFGEPLQMESVLPAI